MLYARGVTPLLHVAAHFEARLAKGTGGACGVRRGLAEGSASDILGHLVSKDGGVDPRVARIERRLWSACWAGAGEHVLSPAARVAQVEGAFGRSWLRRITMAAEADVASPVPMRCSGAFATCGHLRLATGVAAARRSPEQRVLRLLDVCKAGHNCAVGARLDVCLPVLVRARWVFHSGRRGGGLVG